MPNNVTVGGWDNRDDSRPNRARISEARAPAALSRGDAAPLGGKILSRYGTKRCHSRNPYVLVLVVPTMRCPCMLCAGQKASSSQLQIL
jgi:hypothetical protein